MNEIGQQLEIAKFANWWQVITCYGGYLVPVSLAVSHKNFWDQYLHGLLALCILEFCGYSFGTSIPYENNLIDTWFGVRNFSLTMAIFFASYIPLGNALMTYLLRKTEKASSRKLEQQSPSSKALVSLGKSI